MNIDFSNFNVDLSGLGDFSLDLSNLSPFLQYTTSDPSPLDIRKAEIAAEVAAKAGQQPVQSVGQTADLSGYYDALREGTTVSDIDTVGESYDQALNETLAAQGIVDTDYAEGGAVAPSKPIVNAFTAPDYEPRELGEFQGNLSAHTSSSLDQIKEFQARLEPLMAPEMARLQTQEQLDYKDAVEQAYLQNPEIQALYNEYDVKPFRATEDGSIYLYDPFTFGEIRTLEVKDNDLNKAIKAVTQIGVSVLTGGALGATQTLAGVGAAGQAASQAALAGFTTAAYGGDQDDILNSVLIAGGTSLLKGAVDKVKEGVENVAEEALQTVSPELSAELPEIPSDILSFQVDIPDISTRGLLEGYTPFSDPLQAAILDPSVSTTFADPLRAAIAGKGDLAQYGTLEDIATARSAFTPELDIASPATLTPTGGLRENLTREGFSVTGPATSPDIFLELTTDVSPYEYTPSRREVMLREQDPRPVVQPPQPPTQTPGGGGGASGGAASAPATSVVSPSAPSATVTPVVPQPTFAAPGSITSSLFSSFAPALAAAAVVAPQPTVAPPITPVATTAPTSEPTPPTTTQPTDILEDTTAEDTTAQMEAEAEAQRQVEAEAQRQAEAEAQRQAQAEAARLAEEARKAAEARAAAEAKAAAEQEAIAQAEARAVAAEARLAEQQAQAQADAAAAEAARAADAQAQADALAEAVAAGEARYGEAVAAGEALGEAQYGEGLGTGRGQGAGAGIGAGLGLGLLAGIGGGAGGTGGYTPPDFEDYDFRKTYQAPELLELAPQYESYQAPTLQGLFRGFI